MIFVAFFLFLVIFFGLLWVWHHLRKNAYLVKWRLKNRANSHSDPDHSKE